MFFFQMSDGINVRLVDPQGNLMDVGNQVLVDPQQLAILQANQASLKSQYQAIKDMAREAEKKAEVAKFSSPQLKRSVNFLLDSKFVVTDAKEVLEQVATAEAASIPNLLSSLSEKLANLEEKLDAELLANRMAGKSSFGWRTVKFFETDNLFKGEDAEALTKKFKSAEFQAAKASFRGRNRGRDRFQPYQQHQQQQQPQPQRFTRWDSRFPRSVGKPATAAGPSADRPCFNCKGTDHFVAQCPNPKKN